MGLMQVVRHAGKQYRTSPAKAKLDRRWGGEWVAAKVAPEGCGGSVGCSGPSPPHTGLRRRGLLGSSESEPGLQKVAGSPLRLSAFNVGAAQLVVSDEQHVASPGAGAHGSCSSAVLERKVRAEALHRQPRSARLAFGVLAQTHIRDRPLPDSRPRMSRTDFFFQVKRQYTRI